MNENNDNRHEEVQLIGLLQFQRSAVLYETSIQQWIIFQRILFVILCELDKKCCACI